MADRFKSSAVERARIYRELMWRGFTPDQIGMIPDDVMDAMAQLPKPGSTDAPTEV